jgi:cell division protein FtsZ
MAEDLMKFDLPQRRAASIKVIGVGGGGSNAVNHMYHQGIKDVDFIVCNTDVQDLQKSPIPTKIQLGDDLTGGRGAGSNPEVGERAAKESMAQIQALLEDDTQMVFITAGMGGGTGTGAAPIIAEIAKEMGILTVGIVTIPFSFEGKMRYQHAIRGIEALSQNVDSMLIINNETLREKYGNLKITEAFSKADDILTTAAKGIAEIITVNGIVNVDFEDVRTVMQDSGVSIMSSGTSTGENRAYEAIEEALDSPLLNKADIRGAKNILLNFTSGENEVTMDEISIVTHYIIQKAERDVNIIFGIVKDETLTDELSVTLIATGFEIENIPDFKQTVPKKVNELGTVPNAQNTTVHTMKIDESVKGQQTAINWDSITQSNEQVPEKIRLINPNSPFNGENPLHEEPEKPSVVFDYEQVRKMSDITPLEKMTALQRKEVQKQQLAEKQITQPKQESKDAPTRFSLNDSSNGIVINDKNRYMNHNVD